MDMAERSGSHPSILFLSLGLVVLDEIRFASGNVSEDVIGGSAAYSTLGARLFLLPSEAPAIALLINAGFDFPKAARECLEGWGTTFKYQETNDHKSTRGRLVYQDETYTKKTFEYTTPALHVQVADLINNALIPSRSFHILASPVEAIHEITQILELHLKIQRGNRPVIIWEPRPSSCIPENLALFREAVRCVDIFSPNHVELAAIFGDLSEDLSPALIGKHARYFSQSGIGPGGKGYAVIRSGEWGCFLSSDQISFWSPPYYEDISHDKSQTVDTTGAGNAYLGGFVIGYLRHESIYDGACYGAVSASFALEQVGLPVRKLDQSGVETWNGDNVFARLRRYQERFKLCLQGLDRTINPRQANLGRDAY